MTEAEWLANVDILFLFHPQLEVTFRKAKVFALACCRLVENLAPNWPGVKAVDRLDGLVDDLACTENIPEPLRSEWNTEPYSAWFGPTPFDMSDAVLNAALEIFRAPGDGVTRIVLHTKWALQFHPDGEELNRVIASHTRDMFGNPFRPITFDPAWRSSTTLAIAEGIYADRAFDRLPILADALQDAGCEDADILGHLRGAGPHVKGCWALDLVLGKE